jgi:hypothetical protein
MSVLDTPWNQEPGFLTPLPEGLAIEVRLWARQSTQSHNSVLSQHNSRGQLRDRAARENHLWILDLRG